MGSQELNPSDFGITNREVERAKVISEIAANTGIALEGGRLEIVAALDRLEAIALSAIDEKYKEE